MLIFFLSHWRLLLGTCKQCQVTVSFILHVIPCLIFVHQVINYSLLTRVKYVQKSMFFIVAYHSRVILQTQGYRAWHSHESLQTQPVPITCKRFWNDDDNIRNIHIWTLGVWHIKMFTKKLKVYLYTKKKRIDISIRRK